MTRLKLQSAERAGGALHLHWRVEREDGEPLLATVVIATPRADRAEIHTAWEATGTGDDALDAELVRRSDDFLVFAEAAQVAREWLSVGRRPPDGLPPRRDGRRLGVVR